MAINNVTKMKRQSVAFWSMVILAPIVAVFVIFTINSSQPFDNPPNRSGMILHVDAATGCEYLSVYRGGITPRLTKTGKQAGCK